MPVLIQEILINPELSHPWILNNSVNIFSVMLGRVFQG